MTYCWWRSMGRCLCSPTTAAEESIPVNHAAQSVPMARLHPAIVRRAGLALEAASALQSPRRVMPRIDQQGLAISKAACPLTRFNTFSTRARMTPGSSLIR